MCAAPHPRSNFPIAPGRIPATAAGQGVLTHLRQGQTVYLVDAPLLYREVAVARLDDLLQVAPARLVLDGPAAHDKGHLLFLLFQQGQGALRIGDTGQHAGQVGARALLGADHVRVGRLGAADALVALRQAAAAQRKLPAHAHRPAALLDGRWRRRGLVIQQMADIEVHFRRQGGRHAAHAQPGGGGAFARGAQLRLLRVGVFQCLRRQRRKREVGKLRHRLESQRFKLDLRGQTVRQQAVVHQFRIELRALRQLAVHFRCLAQLRLAHHLLHQLRHVAQPLLRLQQAAFQALHVEIGFGQLFRAVRPGPLHVEGGARHLAPGRIHFGAVGAAVVHIPAQAGLHLVRAPLHVQRAIEVVAAPARGLQRRIRKQARTGLFVARLGGGQRRLRGDHLRIARHGARQQGRQAAHGLRLESGRRRGLRRRVRAGECHAE